jgi:hypothetical protein
MIGLVGPTEPLDGDLRLVTEEFESNGGLLLTPDEFMAALNPEYMIEFATPLLGADHPSLVEARTLLENGEFFESLLTVRQALKSISHN